MAPAGYTYEVISENLKDLRCPVCSHLIKDCVELPCAHCMCKNCIEYLENEAIEQEIESACPTCDEIFIKESVKESKAMDRIIRTAVKIKCPQVQLGCSWQGEISSLEWHETLCEFKMVGCDFKGCDGVVMRCNLQKHMDICEYRFDFCDHCSLEMQINELDDHYKLCDFLPVKCSHEECEVEDLIRKELEDHLAKDCIHEKKPCEMKRVGCNELVKNIEMRKHFDESVYEHTQLLVKHTTDLYTLWDDTRKDLEDTNTNLAKTTAVLMETLKKLAETRKELIAAQDDLELMKTQQNNTTNKPTENHNNNNDIADDMNAFRTELNTMKKQQEDETEIRKQEQEMRRSLEKELLKAKEDKTAAESKVDAANKEKENAIAEAKANEAVSAKHMKEMEEIARRVMKEISDKALEDEKPKGKTVIKFKVAHQPEKEEDADVKKINLVRPIIDNGDDQVDGDDEQSTDDDENETTIPDTTIDDTTIDDTTIADTTIVDTKSPKDGQVKRKPAQRRSREELQEATAHIAYPSKALPPEPTNPNPVDIKADIKDDIKDDNKDDIKDDNKDDIKDDNKDDIKDDNKTDIKADNDDGPVYSQVDKSKKKVQVVSPEKDIKESEPNTDTLSKKPKKITFVEPPKNETDDQKASVNGVEPVKGESEPTKKKEPMAKDAKLTKKQQQQQQQQNLAKQQQQNPTLGKGNVKRPDSPLQALVDGLDTDSNVIYCDSYYALMVKLETDRFYRFGTDMYVKINTRGLLRPYDAIYIQPWEERDRMAFQELQYNRRIMHFTDRVAIEVGAKTAIVKILVGCTTSSATAVVLHTQQRTGFFPAFIDKWGWGYNVPSGTQRASFYSQDHILVRIQRRSMSREDLYGM